MLMLIIWGLLQRVNLFAESLNPALLEVATGLAIWILVTVLIHDIISWWKMDESHLDLPYRPRVDREHDDDSSAGRP